MKPFLSVLFTMFTLFSYSQINVNKLKIISQKAENILNHNNLSEDEIVRGLKEALVVGVTNSCANASVAGGFNNNKLIKIPFPEKAKKLKNTHTD